MTLMENIASDMKHAMKANDKFTLSVYRMLKSNLQLEQINQKHELSDEEVISVIKKQVKVRKDSIVEYEKYQRTDFIENLQKEVSILSQYLPEELSEEKVLEAIEQAFSEINPDGMKDMRKIMKLLTERIGSVADMSYVSGVVKEKLR